MNKNMTNEKQNRAVCFSAAELSNRGKDDLPAELSSNTHLIYSSPAALAFNSPGAEGFGVKRAALSIPESVMLVVSPGCCGRNTKLVSDLPGYDNRFFFMEMDETDIVTGRHLGRVCGKVKEIYDSLTPKPKVIVICITCVDALLGTDMERICRRAEEQVPIRVIPSYMYALTREGRKPPMVHVRQSLYSVLEPVAKDSRAANILGYFAPLAAGNELYDILHSAGIRKIREISTCESFDDFMSMASANFNIVLNPEARPAALDLEERLKIPCIELVRLYRPQKIKSQYKALVNVIGGDPQDTKYDELMDYIASFREKHGVLRLSVGECLNADPFELALMFAEQGFEVREIFGTVRDDNFIYIRRLAEISPDTRIYSNLEPTMIYYDGTGCDVDVTLGKDAGYYHPNVSNLKWNADIQPFGYAGVKALFESIDRLLSKNNGLGSVSEDKADNLIENANVKDYDSAGGKTIINSTSEPLGIKYESGVPTCKIYDSDAPDLNPFAPDQSGAVSVLFELGGIQVVCDAGGCAGNICGFDEPRWFDRKSAVFSAGLRDMDAIMGRDDKLAAKLVDAVGKIDASFAAVIGTPVPSVIGTDYPALKKLVKSKTDIPVITVNTNGCEYYDRGASKAYLELMREFAGKTGGEEQADQKETTSVPKENTLSSQDNASVSKDNTLVFQDNTLGVLGLTPLDFGNLNAPSRVREYYAGKGYEDIFSYGMGSGLETVKKAHLVKENLVVSVSGLEAAKYLKKKYGIPYTIYNPLAEEYAETAAKALKLEGLRILIIHEAVTACSMKRELLGRGALKADAATFFMDCPEMDGGADIKLKGVKDLRELGTYDVVFADISLKKFMPGFGGEFFDLPHFALSGRY